MVCGLLPALCTPASNVRWKVSSQPESTHNMAWPRSSRRQPGGSAVVGIWFWVCTWEAHHVRGGSKMKRNVTLRAVVLTSLLSAARSLWGFCTLNHKTCSLCSHVRHIPNVHTTPHSSQNHPQLLCVSSVPHTLQQTNARTQEGFIPNQQEEHSEGVGFCTVGSCRFEVGN